MVSLFPLISWRRITSAAAPNGVPTRARWRTLQGRDLVTRGVVLTPRNGRVFEGRCAVCSILSLDAVLLQRHGHPVEARKAADAAARAESWLRELLGAQEGGSTTEQDPRPAGGTQVELLTRALHRLASPPDRDAEPRGAPNADREPRVDPALASLRRMLLEPPRTSASGPVNALLASWTRLIVTTEQARREWLDVLPVTETPATWESVAQGQAILVLADGQTRRIPLGSSVLDGFSLGDPLIIQQELTEDGVIERLLPAVDLDSRQPPEDEEVGEADVDGSLRPPTFSPDGLAQVEALLKGADDLPIE